MRDNQLIKSLRSVKHVLHQLGEAGTLEPDQEENVLRLLDAIEHAAKVGDVRNMKSSINQLAQLFIRVN